MTFYYEAGKKSFKLLDGLRLFTKDAAVGLSENEYYYVYGMSKMTNAKESQNNSAYFTVQLTEFLELIGRVADFKYSETTGIQLHQKIEFLLDILFELIGVKRYEVAVNKEEESASDDEY